MLSADEENLRTSLGKIFAAFRTNPATRTMQAVKAVRSGNGVARASVGLGTNWDGVETGRDGLETNGDRVEMGRDGLGTNWDGDEIGRDGPGKNWNVHEMGWRMRLA